MLHDMLLCFFTTFDDLEILFTSIIYIGYPKLIMLSRQDFNKDWDNRGRFYIVLYCLS